MELQREVPQYMAIPWLITWVIARTVSANQNINNQSPDNTQTLRDRGTKSDADGMRESKTTAIHLAIKKTRLDITVK